MHTDDKDVGRLYEVRRIFHTIGSLLYWRFTMLVARTLSLSIPNQFVLLRFKISVGFDITLRCWSYNCLTHALYGPLLEHQLGAFVHLHRYHAWSRRQKQENKQSDCVRTHSLIDWS